MGNVCADKATLKYRPNRLSRQILDPKKFFVQGDSLQFEFQTWVGQILPDLRKDTNIIKTNYVVTNQGFIVYDEAQNSIVFQRKPDKYSLSEIFSSRSSRSTQDKENKLIINVQKSQRGYQLNYQHSFIYQLIKQPTQIVEGTKFLLGGTQYKFLKLIDDNSYSAKKVKTLTVIQDIGSLKHVKTRQYIKSFTNITESPQGTPACRICMESQTSKQNPLICPCDCTGSVKYYHISCYTSWAFSTQTNNQNVYVGHVKRQKCDICKKSLLDNHIYRQTIAALLSSVHKIKAPFVVFQGLKPLQDFPYYTNIELTYIILSFANKKKHVIGRSKAVDVQLQIDNSISRINSVLSMKHGKIYLQDADSKHGTYLKADSQINITNDVSRAFLFKNHLISVKIV